MDHQQPEQVLLDRGFPATITRIPPGDNRQNCPARAFGDGTDLGVTGETVWRKPPIGQGSRQRVRWMLVTGQALLSTAPVFTCRRSQPPAIRDRPEPLLGRCPL